MFTHKRTNVIQVDGQDIQINDSFNNCLLLIELMEDTDLDNIDKLALGVELTTGIDCMTPDGDFLQDVDWLSAVFKDALEVIFGVDKDTEASDEPSVKSYDFQVDAERLYASFLQDYEIDLLDQLDKMPFHKFMTLVRQLSDDTPFKKAVSYRLMKIPKETKHNKDEVKRLRKMKEFYKLEADEPRNNDKALDSAFNAFKR